MDLSTRPPRLARVEQRERVRAGRFDPVIVAVFAAAVSAAGAARPSLWFDEAATISASTRSVPELWRLIHNIDAVHGLYYLSMHGWFAVFPATEFWSRLSSCVAVGVAAAGVVILGKQFSTRSVAVCAGIVFVILPRVTWAGIEARSYALTAAAAVWLTVLVVVAARRNAAALWPLYGFALVASTLLNVFVVLMVLVHAVVGGGGGEAPEGALVGRHLGNVIAGCLAISGVLPHPNRAGQMDFTGSAAHFCRHHAGAVFRPQCPVRPSGRRGPGGPVGGAAATGNQEPATRGHRAGVDRATALLLYSVARQPIYYPRYLCYTSPAMALLLAVCIVALVRTRERVTAVLAAFALAATPNYLVGQRGPYAKEGMAFSQVAYFITAHASPGDCLILDNTAAWKPGPIRPLTAARPAAYEKLVDPGRGLRAPQRNRLWDAHLGIWGVVDRVRQCTVLWTVSERDPVMPERQSGPALDPGPRLKRAPAYQVPERLGFHIVERWQFSFAQVVKSTR